MKKNLLMLLLAVSILFQVSTTKAQAEDWQILKQTTGVVLGLGLGPAIGGLRGMMKGWLWGKDETAEALGDKDGVPHQIIGFATGGVVGAAAGGVSGVLMGAYDGLKYGWDKPWSPENFSWAGSNFTDYDPFKWE
jgi:hypothetical protein